MAKRGAGEYTYEVVAMLLGLPDGVTIEGASCDPSKRVVRFELHGVGQELQDGQEAPLVHTEKVGPKQGEHAHRPQQHRDGKPAWCDECGLTRDGKIPVPTWDASNG